MLILLTVLGLMFVLLSMSLLCCGGCSHFIEDRVPAGNGENHSGYTGRQRGY